MKLRKMIIAKPDFLRLQYQLLVNNLIYTGILTDIVYVIHFMQEKWGNYIKNENHFVLSAWSQKNEIHLGFSMGDFERDRAYSDTKNLAIGIAASNANVVEQITTSDFKRFNGHPGYCREEGFPNGTYKKL